MEKADNVVGKEGLRAVPAAPEEEGALWAAADELTLYFREFM